MPDYDNLLSLCQADRNRGISKYCHRDPVLIYIGIALAMTGIKGKMRLPRLFFGLTRSDTLTLGFGQLYY
jgi:hypothetical protein